MDFFVFHEGFPDETCADIFGHQQGDAGINGDDVVIVPVGGGIEAVHEAIAAPAFFVIVLAHGPEDAHGVLGEKWKRAGDGARDEGAVDGTHARRATPNFVAFGGIGCRDAPETFAHVGVLIFEADAEEAMSFGGDDGIGEIIGIAIFLAVEIEPGVGILVDENRGKRANVVELLEFEFGAIPGVPGFRGNGVAFGAEAEKIHHHQLTVGVPSGFKEAAFRMPAVSESEIAIEHPVPIDAPDDLRGEILDFVVIEMAAASEHAAIEERGIDGGDFAFEGALASVHIDEVIVKAVDGGKFIGEIAESGADALDDFGAVEIIALIGDGKGGETETSGGDAGEIAGVGAVGAGAVFNQARDGAGLFPEEADGAAGDFVEKAVIVGADAIARTGQGNGLLGWFLD